MATVAAAAGLSQNTIYRHFPARQDLIEAVRRDSSDITADGADGDQLRPAGELANVSPTPLSVWDVLNKVPPFQLGNQIVAEAHRLPGVTSAAIYLIDLDGHLLRRLAGPENFPLELTVGVAIGPEMPVEMMPAVRADIERLVPGTAIAPMFLRGRATGLLLAIGTADEDLRELAQEAAAALAVAESYTEVTARVRRSAPTSPAAELQQSLLPPRIVRIGGAMLAGNVLPCYDNGGDWFDYTENSEQAWLGIADTQGTGTRAGAVAGVSLAAFRAARHRPGATPATAVHLIHETLLELVDPPPVTATIATWNGVTALLHWITCGERRPILVDAHDQLTVLGETQPVLGAPDFPKRLQIQSRRLKDGERVLFISDGIIDRADGHDHTFGLGGVTRAVQTASDRSAASTLRAIQDAAQAFAAGPLDDDATLMVLAPSRTPGRAPAIKSPGAPHHR